MRTVYVALVAFAFSLGLTPLMRAFARKVGAFYYPNSRSVNKVPIPLLGGIAIYLASVVSLLVVKPGADPVAQSTLMVGGFVILVVGIIDDLHPLKPWQKVIGQVISAAVIMAMGISISFLTDPFSGVLLHLGFIAIPLTLFWVVSFENLINLSDGLDGLAAGIVAITSTVIIFASDKAGAYNIPPIAAALTGSVLGFLPYNFHPASIFMGDAGAMYLGLALAILSVQGLVKSAVFMSVLAPIFALMVPISDTAFAIVRRKLTGQPVSQADHDHLHHRLLELGMGQRRAVLSIYLVSLLFAGLGLISGFVPVRSGGPIAGLAILGLFIAAHKAGLLTINMKAKKDGKEHSSLG